jgi:hypothetical protein
MQSGAIPQMVLRPTWGMRTMSPVSPRRHQSRHHREVVVALVCHRCHQYMCIRAHVHIVVSLYQLLQNHFFTGDNW